MDISQDKLSKLTGIPIESDAAPNPREETLKQIVDALNVGVDDLMK